MATWTYYRTADGRRVVAEEFVALNLDQRGLRAWNELLDAIRDGRASGGTDFKSIQGKRYKGMWEAILKYDGCEYRLLYYHQHEGDEPIILGVRAFQKKSQGTPATHLKVGRARLLEWQKRQRT